MYTYIKRNVLYSIKNLEDLKKLFIFFIGVSMCICTSIYECLWEPDEDMRFLELELQALVN